MLPIMFFRQVSGIGAEEMDFLATRLVPELIPFSLEIAREVVSPIQCPCQSSVSCILFIHMVNLLANSEPDHAVFRCIGHPRGLEKLGFEMSLSKCVANLGCLDQLLLLTIISCFHFLSALLLYPQQASWTFTTARSFTRLLLLLL